MYFPHYKGSRQSLSIDALWYSHIPFRCCSAPCELAAKNLRFSSSNVKRFSQFSVVHPNRHVNKIVEIHCKHVLRPFILLVKA